MDIAAWLQGLGLERYAEAFAENDIDAAILPKLTAEDLLAVGVTSVGHRRKLLEAIAALLPDAELVRVYNSGHMTMMEQPERVNGHLLDLLERCSGRSPRLQAS